MSFLTEFHSEIEMLDTRSQKTFMVAYNTIINFLELADDGSGFTEKYLKDRFYHRPEFKIILNKLILHSVLKKSNEGNYFLNLEKKKLNSAVFDNNLFMADKKNPKSSPDTGYRFLYN